jgi:hypothetical protein
MQYITNNAPLIFDDHQVGTNISDKADRLQCYQKFWTIIFFIYPVSEINRNGHSTLFIIFQFGGADFTPDRSWSVNYSVLDSIPPGVSHLV